MSVADLSFVATVPGVTLAAALRSFVPDRSWAEVRRLVTSGKVTVEGTRVLDPAARLSGGERVELRMRAPDPTRAAAIPAGFRIVFEDPHLVVIEKPEGVSSVPYERKDTGTAMDLVRAEWRRLGRRATATPLYVVHRLDKDTSGLLTFAKTRLGERGMHHIFQKHLADRMYLAVAHGTVTSGRIESQLIADRGDGIRGSTRHRGHGQRAVTRVRAKELLPNARAPRATLCEVRLETGRTHQIRIHLAEEGHPLVGETVYIRDWRRAERQELPSRRLLLHAATLGFEHPVTNESMRWEAPLPPDFETELAQLRGDGGPMGERRP